MNSPHSSHPASPPSVGLDAAAGSILLLGGPDGALSADRRVVRRRWDEISQQRGLIGDFTRIICAPYEAGSSSPEAVCAAANSLRLAVASGAAVVFITPRASGSLSQELLIGATDHLLDEPCEVDVQRTRICPGSVWRWVQAHSPTLRVRAPRVDELASPTAVRGTAWISSRRRPSQFVLAPMFAERGRWLALEVSELVTTARDLECAVGIVIALEGARDEAANAAMCDSETTLAGLGETLPYRFDVDPDGRHVLLDGQRLRTAKVGATHGGAMTLRSRAAALLASILCGHPSPAASPSQRFDLNKALRGATEGRLKIVGRGSEARLSAPCAATERFRQLTKSARLPRVGP